MAIKSFGLQSEYDRIVSVLLHRPGPGIACHPDPPAVLHLEPIDHEALCREFDVIQRFYESRGIRVVQIDPALLCDDRITCFNLMYCRDIIFMTPEGAILGNMAHELRRKDPRYAGRTLAAEGIPVLSAVSGDGRFEAADALWIRPDTVLVGTGRRTNLSGYEQVKSALGKIGVRCHAVPLVQTRTQHLLGIVQIVDRDLALVRSEIAGNDVAPFLNRHGYRVVPVPESAEVMTRQAMNIVTLSPRTVAMTAGCPETRELFKAEGLTIASELELVQLVRGAGGLACATGIISRR